MNFIVSAPGKIILTGEHSVVYGHKAIASSIDLRCHAQITTTTTDNLIHLRLNTVRFDFSIPENEFLELVSKLDNRHLSSMSLDHLALIFNYLNDYKSIDKTHEDFIKPAVAVFFDLYLQTIGDRFLPIDVSISSDFPHNCGLGSSGAYSTALSAALLAVCGHVPVDPALSPAHRTAISDLAYRGERILHGAPSGIDNHISAFGRAVVFQRLADRVVTTPVAIPNWRVLLVDTRVKRCTKTVVKFVRDRLLIDPVTCGRWFGEIHGLTESLEALLGGRAGAGSEALLAGVNRVIGDNHHVLRLLGVSHPTIEEVVDVLGHYGVSGKLTGAGWGGCVFGVVSGLSDERLHGLIEDLSGRGFGTSVTSVSCRGVELTI